MYGQHPYGVAPWASGPWVPFLAVPLDVVYWPAEWCPAPGPTRSHSLQVEANQYGDGYAHRATRGLNPVKIETTYEFPFADAARLQAMDSFLQTYGVGGFYFQPPDKLAPEFVACVQWSASIVDRTPKGAMLGALRATFGRRFNYQPIALIP